MMLRLFLFLIVFSWSPLGWTAKNHVLVKARKLVEADQQWRKDGGGLYKRYLMVNENLTTLQYREMTAQDLAEMQKSSRRLILTDGSRTRLEKAVAEFSNHNLKGPEGRIMNKAAKIARESYKFADTMEANRAYELVLRYQGEGYSIRRSLKNRLLHLPKEIMNFAAAIVIIRMATCFGPSPKEILSGAFTWTNPAKDTDPVCVDEIAEMLQSPVFYAGFSAFVAGSAIASPTMLQLLKKMDPDRGEPNRKKVARYDSFDRNWLSNLSMTAGFIADHIVKALMENQHLVNCAKTIPQHYFKQKKEFEKNMADNVIALVNVGGDTQEVIAAPALFGSPQCQRAIYSITSTQFLTEQIGTGIIGLAAAGTIMAKTFQYGGAAARFADNRTGISHRVNMGKEAVRKAATKKTPLGVVLRKLTWTVGLAGSGAGMAVTIGRFVFFLGIFEVINPYLNEAYQMGQLSKKTDESMMGFATAPFFHYAELDEREESERTETELKNSQDSLKALWGTSGMALLSEEKCPEYHAGLINDTNLPQCTRLPIIAELETFHDKSKVWRSNYVLNKFNMAFGRWQKKLSSFINNYTYSLHSYKSMIRSREMYLNYVETQAQLKDSEDPLEVEDYISQYDKKYRKRLHERINSILHAAIPPSPVGREQLLKHVQEDYQRFINDEFYESPIKDGYQGSPEYLIWKTLSSLDDHYDILEFLPRGSVLGGLPFKNRSDEEIAKQLRILKFQMLKFVGDPDDPDYKFIDVKIEKRRDYALFLNNQELLRQEGKNPALMHYPFDIQIIRDLLKSSDELAIYYAFMLFQEWAPYMEGPVAKRPEGLPIEGRKYNPRGMHPNQYKLYKKITKKLEEYAPMMPWDFLYLITADRDEVELANGHIVQGSYDKEDEDSQQQIMSHNYETKSLADFVLTQMACGKNLSYTSLFGDRGGVALQFPFPHITNETYCQKRLYSPLIIYGENLTSPSRSLFETDYGLRLGLQQTVIQTPMDPDKPLLFRTEAEAANWWNQEMKPSSLAKLSEFEVEYRDVVKKYLFPKITDTEIEYKGSLFGKFSQWASQFWGGQSAGLKNITRSTATNSLSMSIINEFHHYRSALQHLVPGKEWKELDALLAKYKQSCIVQLLNSIPEKKYRGVRRKCAPIKEDVKYKLRSFDGEYETYLDLFMITEAPEEMLTEKQRRHRVMLAIFSKMESLEMEIERYITFAHETFQFDLKTKYQGE